MMKNDCHAPFPHIGEIRSHKRYLRNTDHDIRILSILYHDDGEISVDFEFVKDLPTDNIRFNKDIYYITHYTTLKVQDEV